MHTEDDGLRLAYVVTLVVPLVFVSGVWALAGMETQFLRIALPLIATALALLLVGVVTRTVALSVVGPAMFAVPVAVLFVRLLLWRVGMLPEPGETTDLMSEATWLTVTFPLAFLVFGTRRGVHVSILILGAFLLVSGDALLAALAAGTSDPSFLMALGLPAIFAILITLLWVLASRLERLVQERARADLYAEQAFTDPLTGVANRRRLDDQLNLLIARARRHGRPFSVVLADLDHFKGVNDAFGHDVGDRVLVDVVARLSTSVREVDVLGRWGGEEFLLLAPDTGLAEARRLAERCRTEIARHDLPSGPVTVSLGVTTFAPDDDPRTLMRRADLALYTAKHEGRDRVVALAAMEDPQGADSAQDPAREDSS